MQHTGRNRAIRASVQKAFRDNRPADQRSRAARDTATAVRPPSSRLLKGSTVIMAKPNDEAEHDLSLDIADSVGKTIGNIVNRIEALDTEKAQLIQKLRDTRESLNSQFNKWLPDGLMGAAATVRARGQARGKARYGLHDLRLCHHAAARRPAQGTSRSGRQEKAAQRPPVGRVRSASGVRATRLALLILKRH